MSARFFFPVTLPDHDSGWMRRLFCRSSEFETKALTDALNPFANKTESSPAAARGPAPCDDTVPAYIPFERTPPPLENIHPYELREHVAAIRNDIHDPATCWWCQRGLKLAECSQSGSHV